MIRHADWSKFYKLKDVHPDPDTAFLDVATVPSRSSEVPARGQSIFKKDLDEIHSSGDEPSDAPCRRGKVENLVRDDKPAEYSWEGPGESKARRGDGEDSEYLNEPRRGIRRSTPEEEMAESESGEDEHRSRKRTRQASPNRVVLKENDRRRRSPSVSRSPTRVARRSRSPIQVPETSSGARGRSKQRKVRTKRVKSEASAPPTRHVCRQGATCGTC
jgi:hypothetical protein